MKAKKALKRLKKVETILSNVIDQLPVSARGLRELLDSARASVVRAKGTVNARVARAAKKPAARAQESARLSAGPGSRLMRSSLSYLGSFITPRTSVNEHSEMPKPLLSRPNRSCGDAQRTRVIARFLLAVARSTMCEALRNMSPVSQARAAEFKIELNNVVSQRAKRLSANDL